MMPGPGGLSDRSAYACEIHSGESFCRSPTFDEFRRRYCSGDVIVQHNDLDSQIGNYLLA